MLTLLLSVGIGTCDREGYADESDALANEMSSRCLMRHVLAVRRAVEEDHHRFFQFDRAVQSDKRATSGRLNSILEEVCVATGQWICSSR